jgi:hypothetical protein
MAREPQPQSATVNVQQVNISAAKTNALEAARRLAFAIAKARQMQPLASSPECQTVASPSEPIEMIDVAARKPSAG